MRWHGEKRERSNEEDEVKNRVCNESCRKFNLSRRKEELKDEIENELRRNREESQRIL